jgi:hypothetical protein
VCSWDEKDSDSKSVREKCLQDPKSTENGCSCWQCLSSQQQ